MKELGFPSKLSSILKFEKEFKLIRKELGLDDRKFNNLLVASIEAVTNAIVHGNKNNPEKEVRIRIENLKSRIKVEVMDEGEGFNPDKVPDPTLPENLLKESGRGIYIMKMLTDDVKIKSTKKGTKVILIIKK
jgi:serine/threonine-protein kinase RsbW